MKKVAIFLTIMAVALAQSAISQDITLRFTGATTDGNYVQLDSVWVENVTRSWREAIVYPDTVMSFSLTGIADAQSHASELAAYPNPFNGTTNVTVTLPQSGNAVLQLYNLAGQKVAERSFDLQAGNNIFEVALQKPQVYLLAVTTPQGHSTIKLLNRKAGGGNGISLRGNVVEKRHSTQPFQSGDELKIVGISIINGSVETSQEVLQAQTVSQDFTLLFSASTANLATVTTSAASNVATISADLGGNVTSDGGSTVTHRGICYSTSHNPTTSTGYWTSGSGTGSFTAHVTRFLPATTYYIRAFAINAAGTAYGNEISITTTLPTGALKGLFTVGERGRKVLFSQGNLQWSATGGGSTATTHVVHNNGRAAGTWRFAPNQWDTIGAANSNASSSYTGWIDLFGWGTSGYHNANDTTNTNYQPYSTSNSIVDTARNYYGYGPSTNMRYLDLVRTSALYDWGYYNVISNGGTWPNLWRTLTKGEWDTLLYYRNTSSGIRYAKASIDGLGGLIIVPDNWDTTTYTLNRPNTPSATYSTNALTATQWVSIFESCGCVFLPVTGSRNSQYTSGGFYWSSTHAGATSTQHASSHAYCLNFLSGTIVWGNYLRCSGYSVRVVREPE